jgi:hypothetical protein
MSRSLAYVSPLVPVTLSVASLAAALVGCGAVDDPTPEEALVLEAADLSTAALPDDLAGRAAATFTDEDLAAATRFVADPALPADGDAAALIVAEAGPADAADPAAPTAAPPLHRSARDVVVAVRWGAFPPAPAETWTDWSGFVGVSRGRVEVIRPLRFEHLADGALRPHEDAVRPDADPRLVRFRSHTRGAWDGLLLRVTRPDLRPSVLVIRVGDTTRVLPFEELLELDAREAVDAAGHELRVAARALPRRHPCVEVAGQAAGQWMAEPGDTGLLAGTLTGLGDPLAVVGGTLDVRGPYGLAAVQVRGADGAVVGKARGVYAAFRYGPGGSLTLRARGEGGATGLVVGRWQAGAWQALLLQRDAACAAE